MEIGILPGGTDSQALGVNNSGEVVGWSSTLVDGTYQVDHAVSWTRSGGLVDLQSTVGLGGNYSTASEISDTGQIVGASSTPDGDRHAYSWTRAGGLVDLGTLPGTSQSQASTVNASGQVVGSAGTAASQPGPLKGSSGDAFSWTPSGGMIDLGTFGGSLAAAFGVSNTAIVVGYSDNALGATQAFSWTPQAGLVDLGTLGGYFSAAYAISHNGQDIVGASTTSSSNLRAVYWTKTTGPTGLGTLGGKASVALGVNDAGQAVGFSATASGQDYGVAWSPGTGMVELPPLPGDVASSAVAVNDDGQAVGWSKDAAGHTRAVLWQLPPVSARIFGLRLTPASFRARRRGPAIASKGKNGTRLRFRLTAPALVTFKIIQAVSGRRLGSTCLNISARTLPRCTRYVLLRGSFKHHGKAGENSFWFTGVFRHAPLKPGRYQLIATVRAGSAPTSAQGFDFTVKG